MTNSAVLVIISRIKTLNLFPFDDDPLIVKLFSKIKIIYFLVKVYELIL
jgi:hypothetical protein